MLHFITNLWYDYFGGKGIRESEYLQNQNKITIKIATRIEALDNNEIYVMRLADEEPI
jgi:hypothetical protein